MAKWGIIGGGILALWLGGPIGLALYIALFIVGSLILIASLKIATRLRA